MTRRTVWLLVAMGLAICAGLGQYLVNNIESYEEVVELGPAPEARHNKYLAAEHFLAARKTRFSHADGLEMLRSLPSQGQTLLMLGNREQMTPRQASQVLDWAARGGHLLFIAEALWDEEEGRSGDLLLDRLGIQQYLADELPELEDGEADEQAQTDNNTTAELERELRAASDEEPAPDPYAHLTRLYLENESAPAYFSFSTEFHLFDANDRAHVWANSASATHLMQLYHGDGLITVLSDPWIWENDKISSYDNAWLLWYLTQGTDVTLLHRADSDNLGTLLLRHFPQALVALALLILLLLWHQGMRQGPLLQPRSLARRQLQEHLHSSAEFSLRHGGQAHLLLALQQDIQRRARKRYPGFESLAVAEQWHMLARLSGQSSRSIGLAMRPPASKHQSAALFTDQVAYLQTLRNAL
jgi:hypothetical protein